MTSVSDICEHDLLTVFEPRCDRDDCITASLL